MAPFLVLLRKPQDAERLRDLSPKWLIVKIPSSLTIRQQNVLDKGLWHNNILCVDFKAHQGLLLMWSLGTKTAGRLHRISALTRLGQASSQYSPERSRPLQGLQRLGDRVSLFQLPFMCAYFSVQNHYRHQCWRSIWYPHQTKENIYEGLPTSII